MGLMKKAYIRLNLKKSDGVTYAHNSERRNGPSFEFFETKKKNFKYNFIEVRGKGISFSPILKKSNIFKNKNQKLNPHVKKNEKSIISKNPTKKGSIIDNWQLVFWCKEDFSEKHGNGGFELIYFNELPIGDTWDCYLPSEVSFEILINKETFRKIHKGIMIKYYSSSEYENLIVNNKKDSEIQKYLEQKKEYEGNPFKNNSFKPNKLEIEFDTDDRGKMLMGYDPNTGKRLKKSEKTILGYNFSILSLNLN